MIVSALSALILFCFAMTSALAFDLQGHRGARGLMPENTLPAFAKALSIGVTTLELDTGITKDGVVVVSHNCGLDPDITRGPDGKWVTEKTALKNLTFEELKKYDVGKIKPGSRTAKRFPKQTAVGGTGIPTLGQVFDLVKKSGNESVRFNIEAKINPLKPNDTVGPDEFARAVLAVVSKHGMGKRVSIQSFDWRTLQAVQKNNSEIETVYLTAQQDWLNNVRSDAGLPSRWTAGFNLDDHDGSVPKLIKAAGGKVWSPFFRDLGADTIKQAHALGLKVTPWTVNDKKAMNALIKMGVDGIISDYPDRLREVMSEQGLPLPKRTPVQP